MEAATTFSSTNFAVAPPVLGFASPGGGGGGGGGANTSAVGGLMYGLYEQYEANGAAFGSCLEYTYEKYYEANEFWREVKHYRSDPRIAYEKAFSAFTKTYAVGTHHLDQSPMVGRDGTGFAGTVPVPQVRNRFFYLPEYPYHASVPAVQDAPNLRLSLAYYNLAGLLLAGKVQINAEQITKDMAWHQLMSQSLSVEDAPQLGLAPGTGSGSSSSSGGLAWLVHRR